VPPERLLTAGLPLLTLVPVSAVSRERLTEVLRAVAERLRAEAPPGLMETLWAAAEILLGLNHPKERVKELTEEITTMVLGIRGIEESSVYQDIFTKGKAEGRAEGKAEGRAEQARRILIRYGTKKFGPPDEPTKAQIAALTDLDRLQDLIDRVLRCRGLE
jgi:predicted transposase YdaD